MKNDCVCQHYVAAHSMGSSTSGYGCLATGGHCLPESNPCDLLQEKFIEKENIIKAFEIGEHYEKII